MQSYASASQFVASLPAQATGCVVTDVRMPEMDGLALQRRLAELGFRLPVIVMTGHGDVPIAVEALKAGAVDFLEKPFDDVQLLGAVAKAIAASERTHDEATAVAVIARRLDTLTPREREVLGSAGGRAAEQDDCLRPGLEPAHGRGASRADHGENARPQPAGTGPDDDSGRGARGPGYGKTAARLMQVKAEGWRLDQDAWLWRRVPSAGGGSERYAERVPPAGRGGR